MIHDPEKAREEAIKRPDHVMVFDPTPNSLQGRFYLVPLDRAPMPPSLVPSDERVQVSRKCINQMIKRGMLIVDQEAMEAVRWNPQCRTWPVVRV